MPITFLTNEDKTVIDQKIAQLSEETSNAVQWSDELYDVGESQKATLGYVEQTSDALAYTTRKGEVVVVPTGIGVDGKVIQPDSSGVIAMPDECKPIVATKSQRGGVIIGDGIEVQPDGMISVPLATNTTSGIMRPGKGLNVTDNGQVDVDGVVLFTEIQDMPDNMKETARQNIGAADAQKVEQLSEEIATKQPSGDYALNETVTKDLSVKVTLPINNGTPNHGTAGQFAVSDGKGGIVWKTLVEAEEVSY